MRQFVHARYAGLGLATLALACGEAGAPTQPPTVSLTGPATRKVNFTQNDQGEHIVGCIVPIGVQVQGGGSATVAGLRATFAPLGAPVEGGEAIEISSGELAEEYGAGPIPAGQTKQADLLFAASAPFVVRLELYWRAGGGGERQTAAAHDLDCVPPLLGKFALRSLNGQPPPIAYNAGTLYTDTLIFHPDVRYSMKTTARELEQNGGAFRDATVGPMAYDVGPTDTLYLETFVPSFERGKTVPTDAALDFFIPNCCGRPEFNWHFERVPATGSAVATTPSPKPLTRARVRPASRDRAG